MYLLDFKTVDRVVYRRENSSVQAKVDHDELAKIWSRPVRSGLAGPIPALIYYFIIRRILILDHSDK